jgi:hypothetical protein
VEKPFSKIGVLIFRFFNNQKINGFRKTELLDLYSKSDFDPDLKITGPFFNHSLNIRG